MWYGLQKMLAVGATFAVAPAATCGGGGTLSYNGICTPAQFPPRQNYSRVVPHPAYLSTPPAVINITIGRQLFVDDFLIHNASGVRTRFHTAKYYDHNPVLKPDQPWEGTIAMPFRCVGCGLVRCIIISSLLPLFRFHCLRTPEYDFSTFSLNITSPLLPNLAPCPPALSYI